MTCPHRSALATLVLLAVVLVEVACRPARVPDASDEIAEARGIVETVSAALPLARLACPRLPHPAVCAASVKAAAAVVATAEPLLAPCPDDDGDPTGRYLCEQERLEAVRKTLPDLRAAAADVAALVSGQMPAPRTPTAAPSASAATPPAAASAPAPVTP